MSVQIIIYLISITICYSECEYQAQSLSVLVSCYCLQSLN